MITNLLSGDRLFLPNFPAAVDASFNNELTDVNDSISDNSNKLLFEKFNFHKMIKTF